VSIIITSVLAYLDEANVLGVAAEALPATHQPVLPDQSMRVGADPAAKAIKLGLVQPFCNTSLK